VQTTNNVMQLPAFVQFTFVSSHVKSGLLTSYLVTVRLKASRFLVIFTLGFVPLARSNNAVRLYLFSASM